MDSDPQHTKPFLAPPPPPPVAKWQSCSCCCCRIAHGISVYPYALEQEIYMCVRAQLQSGCTHPPRHHFLIHARLHSGKKGSTAIAASSCERQRYKRKGKGGHAGRYTQLRARQSLSRPLRALHHRLDVASVSPSSPPPPVAVFTTDVAISGRRRQRTTAAPTQPIMKHQSFSLW